VALVLANRVQETATPNTTVSFTLTGAVSGFQSFAVIGNTNTTYYSAFDGSGNWEVGEGTYSTTGPTLARTTVYASSNSGIAVTFPGSVNVFVTYPSGKSVNLDGSGNVSALGTVTSGTWQGSTVGVAYGGTGVTASSGPNSVVLRDSNANITVNRINQGIQTITASGGTTTLTAASQFNQALVGTGGHTFRLPDATTLTDTTAFQFNNNATGTLTIENNAGTTVGTIAAGGAAGIALLNNTTVGGTWDIHGYIPENVTWGTNALALGTTTISGGTWQGGTIAPDYGGTGLTTFVGANNALYSTSASALTAGILPVAAGGTGTSTPSLVAGTNITITGTWPNQTIDASGGGGGGFDVGEIVESAVAPSTGTWLACGGYYSKTSYPALAAELGNVPNMGNSVGPPENKLPYPITVAPRATSTPRHMIATNGTRYVISGTGSAGTSICSLTSTDNDTWVNTATNWPDSSVPNELQYLNGKFILIGSNAICVSSDGINWRNTYYSSSFVNISSVAYGAGRYVVTSSTANITLTSVDGENWTTLVNAGNSSTFTGGRIAFGNSRFVIISSTGSTLYSSDGISWTVGSMGLSSTTDLLFANGVFVAANGTNIRYSSDGITWVTALAILSPWILNAVKYVNNNFIAMGQNGFYYSADGITWTIGLSYASTNISFTVNDVVWDGAQYLIATASNRIFSSSSISGPYTISYSPVTAQSSAGISLLAAFNSKITAFGQEISFKVTGATSIEPIAYGRRLNYGLSFLNNPKPDFGAHVAYDGVGRYVFVSSSAIFTSTNPYGSWSPTGETLAPWGARIVSYQNGNFIAAWGTGVGVTFSGGIFYSSNGTTWNLVTGLPILNPCGIYWTGTLYVLVHSRGVLTSPDLVTWTARLTLGTSTLLFINVEAGVIIIGGSNGALYTSASTDGITWANKTIATANSFNGAVYSPTLLQWVAYGSVGMLYRSADAGVTWSSVSSGITSEFLSAVWCAGFWAIAGQNGSYITSTNTTSWTVYRWPNTNLANIGIYLSWDGTNVLAATGAGLYASSSNQGINWNQVSVRKGPDYENGYAGQLNTLNVWYINGIYFSAGTSSVEASTDFVQWRTIFNRNPLYTAATRLTVVGSYLYYINQAAGVSYSTNGVDFTFIQDLPFSTTAIGFGGGVYIAIAGASVVSVMPQIYRSTNGLDWNLVQNIANPWGATAALSWNNNVVDVAYASGAFLVCWGTAPNASVGSQGTLLRSSDGGLTWSAAMNLSGVTGQQNGRMASDGTTLFLTAGQGVFKTVDGGLTWNLLNSTDSTSGGGVAYSNSKWVWSSRGPTVSVSSNGTDWVMTARSGFALPSQFVIAGNYLVTAISLFGFTVNSLNGGGAVSSNLQLIFNLQNSWQDERFVKANNKVLFLAQRNNYAINQNIISEVPLYSYNTLTTFYVPPTGGSQPSWIYAGP
jgi:hypothetical protein